MMARSVGWDVDAAETLLAHLEPVLADDLSAGSQRVVVTGDGPLADELRRLLAADGVLTAADDPAPELAVIVAGWLIGAEDHGRWLRRDIPHLRRDRPDPRTGPDQRECEGDVDRTAPRRQARTRGARDQQKREREDDLDGSGRDQKAASADAAHRYG